MLDHDEHKISIHKNWIKISDFPLSQIGFQFLTRNFLYKFVKEIVVQMIETGILQKSIAVPNTIRIAYDSDESEWRFGDIERFKFTFVLWIVCCVICAVLFVLEIFCDLPEIVD